MARKTRKRRKQFKTGLPPGTLVIDPAAAAPKFTLMEYSQTTFKEVPSAALSQITRPKFDSGSPNSTNPAAGTTWVDVVGLGDAGTLQELAQIFGIHSLALEDVVHHQQRPKVEVYGDKVFVVVIVPDTDSHGKVSYEQVSLFLGPGFVLTFQEDSQPCFEPVRERLRTGRGRVRSAGADYLTYALIDAIVDHYFPIAEAISDELAETEEHLLQSRKSNVISSILEQRKELAQLRRNIRPLRDALGTLRSENMPQISADTRIYFRDCYDHAIQIADRVEGTHEFASSLIEIELSMASRQMNEVMKMLTMIATIFIPLSFVAGVYGMNFDTSSPYNMPELRAKYGYPVVLGAMFAIGIAMLVYFRRKKWI